MDVCLEFLLFSGTQITVVRFACESVNYGWYNNSADEGSVVPLEGSVALTDSLLSV